MKIVAEQSFDKVISRVDNNYKKFCTITNQKYDALPWKANIMTYSELYKKVKYKYGDKLLYSKINSLSKDLLDEGMDIREVCLNIVDRLWKMNNEKRPAIILFFAPPLLSS